MKNAWVYCFLVCIGLAWTSNCDAQINIVRKRTVTGKVVSVSGDKITVATDKGDDVFQFAKQDENVITLAKGGIRLRFDTSISVSGKIAASNLVPGQVIKLKALLSKPGNSKGEVAELELISEDSAVFSITPSREAKTSRDFLECEVIAKVDTIRGTALNLQLPRQAFTKPGGKLRIRLAKDATLSISENSVARVRTGDEVVRLVAADLDTGDSVVESMQIKLAAGKQTDSNAKSTASKDPFAPSNYLKFSDKPSKPRDVRSAHFLLHTDISDRSAKILLDKLERMVTLISGYYGRGLNGIIECYVVRDLSQWKNYALDPAGVAKIKEPAGVTLSRSLGKQRFSVVYSCDDHGVVQHESVHAFCFLTFGSTGPTWYSEGMAEMGQYWKDKNLAVEINPLVIRYLTKAKPKRMLDIVAAGQITGDSWQAYAWRWALCHLLANNPNYSARFKSLGLNMMAGGGATFESVYGDIAKEISFEYDQFVQNFGNGYRVDLCIWDWNSKPRPIPIGRNQICKVEAARGWQSSKLKINAGKKYDYVCKGQWQTSKSGKPTDGNGDDDGNGKLVAVVFADYNLSKVIELGQQGSFTAEQDGHLYVRCMDKFTELSDNTGELKVYFRRSAEK